MHPRGPQMDQNAATKRDFSLGAISKLIYTIFRSQNGAQKRSKTLCWCSQAPRGRPEAAREPPGSHFGLLLGPLEPENLVQYEVLAPGSFENHVNFEVLA